MRDASGNMTIELNSENMFFIIGAPKCGTTALSEYLRMHPQVAFSKPKEPHYFSPDYPFGPRLYNGVSDYFKSCYDSAEQGNHKAFGEASVFYLYSKFAVENIEYYVPGAKYIVMLRNPVDAAFSMHSQHVAFGWEPNRDFISTLVRPEVKDDYCKFSCEKFWKASIYKDLFNYSKYINHLLSCVHRDRVMFILYEDFFDNVEVKYAEVLSFINVDCIFPNSFNRFNEARRIRWRWLAEMLRSNVALRGASVARKLVAPNGFGLGRPTPILSESDRAKAWRLFYDDALETSMLVGFNINLWESKDVLDGG